MIRAWVAVALLSASWLFGQGYFDPPQPLWAALAVIVGVALLAQKKGSDPFFEADPFSGRLGTVRRYASPCCYRPSGSCLGRRNGFRCC